MALPIQQSMLASDYPDNLALHQDVAEWVAHYGKGLVGWM